MQAETIRKKSIDWYKYNSQLTANPADYDIFQSIGMVHGTCILHVV